MILNCMEKDRSWRRTYGGLALVVASMAAAPAAGQCIMDVSQKTTASDAFQRDKFGNAVAVYGDVAVVGAYTEDYNDLYDAGSAYWFLFNGSIWEQQAERLHASDPAVNARFGESVAIDGDVMAIGAPWRNGGEGAVYIFRRTGNTWNETHILSGPGDAGAFGQSVAVYSGANEDIVVCGAPEEYESPYAEGAAYVYQYDGSSWDAGERFVHADPDGAAGFGASVSVDGDVFIVGAPFNGTNSGSATIYRYNGSDWLQDAHFQYPEFAHFGTSVDVVGDTAIVGAPRARVAHIYNYAAGQWAGPVEIAPMDPQTDTDWFGYSVSLGVDVVIIGAPETTANDADSGTAYSFAYDSETEMWIEQWMLVPSDGEDDDLFGSSVAAGGDTALIGVPNDDDAGTNSGSAHFFDIDEFDDCNENLVPDHCELLENDCNGNGIPDDCDIADGTSIDCQLNGIPDECEYLYEEITDVHVIFVVDTSSSMVDEATGDYDFCADYNQFILNLETGLPGGITLHVDGLKITGGGISDFDGCLNLVEMVDTIYDLDEPDCAGGEVNDEAWGPATAIVAAGETGQGTAWEGQVRIIVPFSDEAPYFGNEQYTCGTEPGNEHRDSIDCAIATAKDHSVNIFPLRGLGATSCVSDLMDLLAIKTAGERFSTDDEPVDWPTNLAASIVDLVQTALEQQLDCNTNEIPDSCDVDLTDPDQNGEISCDRNENGVPDECEGLCPWDVDGSLEVDIDDLFLVLGNWGPCEDCPEDVNCSGEVDIDDVFAVLGNWGPCPDGNGVGAPQGIIDCILQYASDPEALATCIEAMRIIGAGQ